METILLVVLGIINLLLQGFDFYSTKKLLGKGYTEKNPIARWFMDKIGLMPTLILGKGIASLITVGMVYAGLAYSLEYYFTGLLILSAGLYVYLFWNNNFDVFR